MYKFDCNYLLLFKIIIFVFKIIESMQFKRLFLPFILGISIVPSLFADDVMRSSFRCRVDSLSARVENDSVEVVLGLGFPKDKVAHGRAVVLRSSIEWEGGSMFLRPVSVYCPGPRGKMPRLYAKEGPASGDSLEVIMDSGDCDSLLLLKGKMPLLDEMRKEMKVYISMEERAIGQTVKSGRKIVGQFVRKPAPEFNPVLFLQDGERISGVSEISVPLVVQYNKGVSTIDESLPGNAAAVCSFVESCNLVSSVPGVRVKSAEIRTWTGITEKASSNKKISSSRASDIARLLSGSRILGKVKISSKGMGEDWDSVSKWIESTSWSSEGRVISTLQLSRNEPDLAESRLRLEFPVLWDAMERMLFDGLSRSECVLGVQAGPYETSDLPMIYSMNNRLMSVYDHVRLAGTYVYGSYPWCDILLSCAEIYPDSPVASFNAASALLTMGRPKEAIKWIEKCSRDSEDMYLKAVWLIMSGYVQEGASLLGKISLDRRGGVLEAAMMSVRKMVTYVEDSCPWNVFVDNESTTHE